MFKSFEHNKIDSPEWWFFRRLREMDLITAYPVLLWLMAQPPDVLPATSRRRALTAIESFLVRRLIRRDTTRGYGDLFIALLQVAQEGDPGQADDRLVAHLAAKTADTDKWPSDEELRSAVLTTNIYKLKQSRLKMILEAIERQMVNV